MAMGGPGDNPLADILQFGLHPFPPDVEELVLKVHKLNPHLPNFLDLFEWEAGIGLDSASKNCKEILERFPKEGISYLEELIDKEPHPVKKHNLRFFLKRLKYPDAKVIAADPSPGAKGCLLGPFFFGQKYVD